MPAAELVRSMVSTSSPAPRQTAYRLGGASSRSYDRSGIRFANGRQSIGDEDQHGGALESAPAIPQQPGRRCCLRCERRMKAWPLTSDGLEQTGGEEAGCGAEGRIESITAPNCRAHTRQQPLPAPVFAVHVARDIEHWHDSLVHPFLSFPRQVTSNRRIRPHRMAYNQNVNGDVPASWLGGRRDRGGRPWLRS
jgi:hypothetical protein